ncbi:hypothetical protein BDV33DRAFT_119420 [Aspergillus novoparasiticus]|uniref:Secreted protein n=1 Tax=Aspergillus novoparasiticus TaxID=986946 RepID=A0A5N6EMI7_9EURO|nr:hypothetical protein BDV33DRAFT_119420 [Aspergillus novoparasiticus]
MIDCLMCVYLLRPMLLTVSLSDCIRLKLFLYNDLGYRTVQLVHGLFLSPNDVCVIGQPTWSSAKTRTGKWS